MKAFAFAVAFSLSTTLAFANPLVDEAIERFATADFAGALEALDRAEQSNDLNREDLVTLFRYRVLIAHATQREVAMQEALLALASLEPAHQFGSAQPPMLQQAFDRLVRDAGIREPVTLALEPEPSESEVRLRAEVLHDMASLVRKVRIGVRSESEPFDVEDSADRTVVRPRGALEYFAEAVGPGGAVIASVGTARAPRSLAFERATPASVGRDLGDPVGPPRKGRSRKAVWWVVGSLAVLAAGGIAVGLTLAARDGTTEVVLPSGLPEP